MGEGRSPEDLLLEKAGTETRTTSGMTELSVEVVRLTAEGFMSATAVDVGCHASDVDEKCKLLSEHMMLLLPCFRAATRCSGDEAHDSLLSGDVDSEKSTTESLNSGGGDIWKVSFNSTTTRSSTFTSEESVRGSFSIPRETVGVRQTDAEVDACRCPHVKWADAH